jgi:hypothetical protein
VSGAQPAELTAATYRRRRYLIERRAGYAPDTIVETFPGIGLVGSDRRWLGGRWATRATWWAARNPSGQPGQATAQLIVPVPAGGATVAARRPAGGPVMARLWLGGGGDGARGTSGCRTSGPSSPPASATSCSRSTWSPVSTPTPRWPH